MNRMLKKIGLLGLLAWSCVAGAQTLLPNAFSVAAGRQVYIAPSNLQYTQSTGEWAFAEHPYTILGNQNVSDVSLADKIDLFGWSGDRATYPWGVGISINNFDYSGDFADWGQNTIGTDEPNTWRTMTEAEWTYLLTGRGANLSGIARINLSGGGYVNGLVLLPDTWTCPAGFVFRSGISTESSQQAYADYQTFSVAQWDTLAAAGAVFLPASGYRYGFSLDEIGIAAQYWTATETDDVSQAISAGFTANSLNEIGSSDRRFGMLVRLVNDIIFRSITVAPCDYGTVTVSQTQGMRGDVVTVTTKSDSLCSLHSLRVLQGTKTIPTTPVAGQSGQYTFVMPHGEVVVKAIFHGPAPAFTPKEFSVSATQKVYFSPGNLTCTGTGSDQPTWEFAYYQTDTIGAENVSGKALADRIDLFGWSGDTGTAKWGISTSEVLTDYSGNFVDWGQNTIGTDVPNTWRTPTQAEWNYLINSRPNADELLGVAQIQVNESGTSYVNGLVLLPDNWICPDEVAFETGWGHGYMDQGYSDKQVISHADWLKLEATGAVLLPALGDRLGTSVNNVQLIGVYQSATPASDGNLAYYLSFTPTEATTSLYFVRSYGLSVRLVRDKNKTPTDLTPTPSAKRAKKYLKDGRLIIEVDGKKYDAEGSWVN